MSKLSHQQLEQYLNWAENVDEPEIRAKAIAGLREHILALEETIDLAEARAEKVLKEVKELGVMVKELRPLVKAIEKRSA